MIDDPIVTEYTSFSSAFAELRYRLPERNQIFLVFSPGKPFLVMSDRTGELWGTQPECDYRFFWDGSIFGHSNIRCYSSDCSKERFVDWLGEMYPSHLEWMLWHPEWL